MHPTEKAVQPPVHQYTPPYNPRTASEYKSPNFQVRLCPKCGVNPKRHRSATCVNCYILAGRPPVDGNIYLIEGVECRKIPVLRDTYSTVDAADYDFLMQWAWAKTEDKCPHVASRSKKVNGVRRRIQMHRVILDVYDPAIIVDHINRDGLDNRRKNLRTVTPEHSSWNKSLSTLSKTGYIGVSCSDGHFVSNISHNKQQIYLGQFERAEDAARTRDAAVRFLREEEYWVLNFPSDPPIFLSEKLLARLRSVSRESAASATNITS